MQRIPSPCLVFQHTNPSFTVSSSSSSSYLHHINSSSTPSPTIHFKKTEIMSSCFGIPNWLQKLMSEKFFNPCSNHEGIKKNEKNILCLDCCFGFCPHCVPPHRSHRLLQIRRYVYHDVVRMEDLEKLIDLSLVQSYTTNSAKVVFLKQRPQSRPFRSSGNECRSCGRPLQDSFFYCSLSCKVKQLMLSEGQVSRHLRKCDYLLLSMDEEVLLTPDSILESPGHDSSCSNGSGNGAVVTESCSRRKRGCVEQAVSYRKRTRKMTRPNRSPLF